jgi:hypothetical protein
MLQRGRNVSLATTHGDVDLVRRLPGVPDYDSLLQDAERFEVDGLTITVASPAQLIAMKQARGSAQDEADIENLRLLDHDD